MLQRSHIFMTIALIACNYASAASFESNQTSDLPWYVSLEAGWSKPGYEDISGYTTTFNESGGRLAIGYAYPITEKTTIGPEIGVGYYGETFDDDDTSNEVDTWSSYGIDFLINIDRALSDKLHITAKAGKVYATTDAESNIGSSPTNADRWVNMYGAGIGYYVNNHWNYTLMYYYINGDNYDVAKSDSLFVGATFHF